MYKIIKKLSNWLLKVEDDEWKYNLIDENLNFISKQ